MQTIKRNIPFMLLFIIGIFCISQKNISITETVALYPNTSLEFVTESSISQSWSPSTKKINGITLPYVAESDFTSDIILKVVPDTSYTNQEPLLVTSVNDILFRSGESGQLDFRFNPLSLTTGQRYNFIFEYSGNSLTGSIHIPSSTEYAGCYIDGKDTGQGLSIQVSSIKSSRISWLFRVFMPLISISFFLMLICKRKFEEVVALALSLVIGILYISGLCEHLEIGIYFLYAFAFILFLAALYFYNKFHTNWKELLSPGLLIFGIFIIIIIFYNNNIYRARWDEYSHWGLAVKDMYYYNSFAKHIDSTVMLPWYPPFITLFQYYMEYSNGLFTEEFLYIAFQITMLSFLLITVKCVVKKNWQYLIPGLSIMLLVPLIFFPDVYNSIYVDPLLSIYVAYILLCYYTESMSTFNFLRIAGGLFALILTKETGAPIAGLIIIIFFLDTIYKKKKIFTKTLLISCSFMLLVFTFFFSWRIYLTIPAPIQDIEINTEFSELYDNNNTDNGITPPTVVATPHTTDNFTFQNFKNLIMKKAPDWNYKCIKNFIKAMFSGASYDLGIASVSVFDILFFILLASILLPQTTIFKNDNNIRSLCFFGVLCGLPYLTFLLFSYLFAFSPTEAVILHSYPRYCGSYIAGIVLAIMIYVYIKLCENSIFFSCNSLLKIKPWTICISVSIILLIIAPVENFVIKNMDSETPSEYVYGGDEFSSVLSSFSDRSEKIYIVCNNSTGFSYFVFRNFASPLQTQEKAWSLFSSKDMYLKYNETYPEHPDSTPTILSVKEWTEQLGAQYDYVFLLHPNEFFYDMYGCIFENPSTIGDGTFYRIEKNDEKVQLTYIGKIGIKAYK